MEEKKPKKDILEKIKKEKISPKSHFQVHWKNYVFWIVWGAIMIFGAISFSLLLLNVLDIRTVFLRELGIGRYLRLLMETAPYLWVILVAIAFGTGYFAMRKTRTGYRYSIIFITTIIVLIISMAGALLHLSKFNRHVGEKMIHSQRMVDVGFPAKERFSRPGDGTMAGRITNVSENEIVIENMRGKEWVILYDDKTRLDSRKNLEEGMHIIAIGEKVEKKSFKAESIRELPKHLRFEQRGNGEKPPKPQKEMRLDR